MSEPENNTPPPLRPAENQPVSAAARLIFMPESFSSVGREWADWTEQFEMAADVNNWDEPLKLKFLCLLLSDKAREVYNGLSGSVKANYAMLKEQMGKCLDPCDSADWNRAVFSARRRWHNESVREFGMALRRSAVKAYPTADPNTQDLLTKDQFIAHVGNGDMSVCLRSAKPASLEAAINLAAELELIRGLETSSVSDARVRGITEKDADDESIASLVGVVESLRQEVVVMQTDTVVPPRSEAIISGQIKDSWGDYAQGLLEPSDHLSKRCDLLVARVICKVDQGQLPVRVINVSDDPLMLKGGMRVGTLFTDVEVEDERTDRVNKEQGSQPWTVESLMTQFRVVREDSPLRKSQQLDSCSYKICLYSVKGIQTWEKHRLSRMKLTLGRLHP
uniref:Retrotransposon gag domain-containing protein n=1 Tax=Nothobranchius rachovii TaxID=451742 RepID=A0A1A8PU43_9TELE